MSNSIKFNYNSNNKIFYKYYYGDIYIEDIVNSWNDIINNNKLPNDFKGIIVELKNGNIKMTIEELIGVSQYYKKNIDVFGNKKIGYITNNPTQTVYSMLVEQKDKDYQTKTFSHLGAAEHWVLQ